MIQDELHLITGPLGTMMGLYETAIEGLCAVGHQGSVAERGSRPKIVASTATARDARNQVQAVFARAGTRVFPPPGPNRRDSFFAGVKPADEVPARGYLGIAATGRNPKVVMRRVMLALMGSAHTHYASRIVWRSPGVSSRAGTASGRARSSRSGWRSACPGFQIRRRFGPRH